MEEMWWWSANHDSKTVIKDIVFEVEQDKCDGCSLILHAFCFLLSLESFSLRFILRFFFFMLLDMGSHVLRILYICWTVKPVFRPSGKPSSGPRHGCLAWSTTCTDAIWYQSCVTINMSDLYYVLLEVLQRRLNYWYIKAVVPRTGAL